MTRDILVYLLDCGCTDWCTCNQCGITEPHQPGTGWHCDDHGPTNVKQYVEVPDTSAPINDGDVAVIGSPDSIVFAVDHPMRAGRCAVCSLPIGGEPATILAVIGLGGPSCHCGQVPAGAYLIHASHSDMPQPQLMAAVEVAMTCQETHPWDE